MVAEIPPRPASTGPPERIKRFTIQYEEIDSALGLLRSARAELAVPALVTAIAYTRPHSTRPTSRNSLSRRSCACLSKVWHCR